MQQAVRLPARRILMRARLSVVLVTTCLTTSLSAQANLPAPWDSVGRVLQAGGISVGGYYRYNLPRRDITLRWNDVTVAAALGLGAWAGFGGEPGDAIMMGDLVLTASEVGPVEAELARQRIDITAVHNHLV